MGITIGGLSSGLDTESMIDQLMAASNKPGDLLVSQRTEVQDRKTQYETLNTRLANLQTALEAIDTERTFRALKASSSDTSVVEIAVDGDAVVGAFDVEVSQLAQSSMLVSDGFASESSAGTIAEGDLVITVGSVSTTLTITSSNSSLEGLVSAINSQVEGVTAYVMDTGLSTDPYRLVLVGDDSGADNAVSLDTSGLTGGSGEVPSFSTAREAQDAIATINGVEVHDADNELGDAIQGVTFTALRQSSETVTVQVMRDDDAMVERLSAFVDAYNAVVSHVGVERIWDSATDNKGAFVGESLPRSVLQGLRSVISASYSSGTDIQSLSGLGITTARTGLLELDTDDLKTALASNFEDVVALFTDADDGLNAALQDKLDTYTDSLDGLVGERVDNLDDQIDRLNDRILRFEDQMDALEERLRASFTRMETVMEQAEASMTLLEQLLKNSSESS